MNSKTSCNHINDIQAVIQPTEHVCQECVKTGSTWVHLRTCQTCGITLCCDSSPNKHARQHANETGHPVIASAEPGENWLWCYIDETFGKY